MAVAFDAVGPSSAGTSSTTTAALTWTHVCGASATLLLVGVAMGNDSGSDASTLLSATYNGVAMTSLGKVHSNNQTAGYVELFGLLNPATGSHTVSVAMTGGFSGTDTRSAGSVSYTGTSTSSLPTATTAYGSGATPSVTVSSATGNMVASAQCCGAGFTGASDTLRYRKNSNTNSAAGNVQFNDAAGSSSVTITGTEPGDWWGIVGVNIAAAGVGGTPGTLTAVVGDGAAAGGVTTFRGSDNGTLDTVVGDAPGGGGVVVFRDGSDNGLGSLWFTDYSGSPALLVNAEDWGMLANAGVNNSGDVDATLDDYFSTRQAQGFNSVLVCWCSYQQLDDGRNGSDTDGTFPFATNMDPTTTPDETFWGRRDALFTTAATYGCRVIFNVSTSRMSLGTTAPAQRSWTTAQWTAFGTFLGTRYASVPNILWHIGDDYNQEFDDEFTAFHTALRAAGANQPFSLQYAQESTSRYDMHSGGGGEKNLADLAEYNYGYSYNVTYLVTEAMQAETDPIPYLWGDGYFLHMAASPYTTQHLMRQMVWWALSSGSKGFTIGDDDVWPWDSGALAHLTSETFYTDQVPAIADYFSALPGWHLLEADVDSDLVTAGRGTKKGLYSSDQFYGEGSGGGGTGDSDSYVTASRTPNGSLAVIYMSHASTITIDETKMAAGYTATWVDPASGDTAAATAGSSYDSSDPGTNSDGGADWVLVLQSAAVAATFTTVVGDAPAAGGTVTMTGAATFTTVVGDAPAAGGTAAFTAPGTLTTVVGDAPAAGGTVTMSAGVVLATSVGDAPASGGSVTYTAGAVFSTSVGDAPASGGSGALAGGSASTLTGLTGDAPAAGGTVTFTAGAVFSTAVGDAPAGGGTVSLVVGVVFTTVVGDAPAAGGAATFSGATASTFVAVVGNADASGGGVTFLAGGVFSTTVGDAPAAGGLGGLRVGDVIASGIIVARVLARRVDAAATPRRIEAR